MDFWSFDRLYSHCCNYATVRKIIFGTVDPFLVEMFSRKIFLFSYFLCYTSPYINNIKLLGRSFKGCQD